MKQKDVIPAENTWVERNIKELSGSPSNLFGTDWALITCGDVSADKGNWNTMTASWGALGVLWGMDVAFMFIRPSRHTFGFANNASLFTLSFFDSPYRKALEICGEKSGRDTDKAAAAGITPIVFTGGYARGALSFKEAREVIVCRKLYTEDFSPAKFLEPASIEKNYNGKDYHRIFIGEALGLLTKK
jgi:flavin reductase (DIM6/NTAB) family NADH-FMN oxidoreductase RutF